MTSRPSRGWHMGHGTFVKRVRVSVRVRVKVSVSVRMIVSEGETVSVSE